MRFIDLLLDRIRFIDLLPRRKPKSRGMDKLARGAKPEQIAATKVALSELTLGERPVADRFPKLADSAPAVLTRPPVNANAVNANTAVPLEEAVVSSGNTAAVPSVNIWDLEEGPASFARAPVSSAGVAGPAGPVSSRMAEPAEQMSSPRMPEPVSSPRMSEPVPEAAERRRPTRTKTRILGFEPQPTAVVPLFEDGEKPVLPVEPATPGQGHVMFPTGWLVVKAGPGRGAAFALSQGVSQIGRGVDQTVALDFGDMSISRQNHASIAYDPSSHRFHIGHGGKSNLVRLNGKPLLSTEDMSDGDEIQIGETTLLLKVLCTPAFNWTAPEAGGDGHDVAIA